MLPLLPSFSSIIILLHMNSILFVLTRSLLPPEKGDARLCYYRSKYLSSLGYQVSILEIVPSFRSQSLCKRTSPRDLPFHVYTVRLSYLKLLRSIISVFFSYPSIPLQCSISKHQSIHAIFNQALASIKPDLVHFLTARTYFLWHQCPAELPVVRDFIDSYTLNYSTLLKSSPPYAPIPLNVILRFYYQLELRRFSKLEKSELYPAYANHRTLFVSPRDIAFLCEKVSDYANKQNQPLSIPIGLDPLNISRETLTQANPSSCLHILFYGTLSYLPNLNAALFILNQLYPRIIDEISDFKISIAGRNAPRSLYKLCSMLSNVSLISPVDDMNALIKSADVVCAPVSFGSGLQFKIIEPMSAHTPVITSTFCASGFDISDGQYCLVANSLDDYVLKLKYILSYPVETKAMADRAYHFSKRYTWETTVNTLHHLYRQLN